MHKKYQYMLYIEKNNKSGIDEPLRSYIDRFLKENDISSKSASTIFNMSRSSLEKYLKGEKWQWKVSQLRILSDFLGIDLEGIVDAAERDETEEADSSNAKVCSYILSTFDIDTLKKLKIIPPRTTIESYEEILNNYFGFNSIFEYDSIVLSSSLFSKSKVKIEDEKKAKMTAMWIKTAVIACDSINNPNNYEKEILEIFLQRIPKYTIDFEKGFYKVVAALFKMGITVIVQPYLSCTGVFGTSMIRNGKPLIIISDYQKKYHRLWMTLLHELYHILNDYEILENNGYHTSSQDNDIFFDEDAADRFAMKVLVPEKVINAISKNITIPYLVERASKEIGVHPSIMYGICYEWNYKNGIELKMDHRKKIPSDGAITDICFDPIKKRSVSEAVSAINNCLIRLTV